MTPMDAIDAEEEPMELDVEEEYDDEDEELAQEEEEGEEEDGEEEGDEVDVSDLYGEKNPLDFLKESRGDLYRRLEQLEFDARAERKRKALSQPSITREKKPRNETVLGATAEEIEELMSFGTGRRRRKRRFKKKGRRKGSKNNLNPEATKKLGDATLFYASENYDKAIPLLKEVITIAACSDAYHLLGLIYEDMGEKQKASDFHILAAFSAPKDSSLWRKLVGWSIEEKNIGQLRYCLKKAISADPKNVSLRFDLASLFTELGEYQKAAKLYNKVVELYPENIAARKMAAKMYEKCGQVEKAIGILEEFVNDHSRECDPSLLDQLVTLQIESNAHAEALQHIENTCFLSSEGHKVPLYLKAKAAICYAHLGNVENAEVLFKEMQMDNAGDTCDSIAEFSGVNLSIAQCYLSKKEIGKAIPFFYKALSTTEDNIDARLTLSSLLLKEGRPDDAISLLSPPKSTEPVSNLEFAEPKPWWLSTKVKFELAKIYRAKGMLNNFVDLIFPLVRDTLVIEAIRRRARSRKKRLSLRVLAERAKLIDDHKDDDRVLHTKPVASNSDLVKARRAKKLLEKKAALVDEKKEAARAAGMDWQSEESEEDAPDDNHTKEPPLPGLLVDEEHRQLILELCKDLISLGYFLKALEIINLTLRVADSKLSAERKEEFRSLGGRIAYSTKDPKHGFNYVKYLVMQNPYSIAAWNCLYNVVSSHSVNRVYRGYIRFMHRARVARPDCVAPLVISGHQLTMISQHQSAAREYLQAYRLQPENPLINLCVGTALINLALGYRVQNKNQSVVQGFAFLYNYLRICDHSQEALYNVARAYHHVGLITLAASYYEKVLSKQVKDYALPKLLYEGSVVSERQDTVYCSLHREAAYNLHLIYKKSGAVDLARQILKDYCTI